MLLTVFLSDQTPPESDTTQVHYRKSIILNRVKVIIYTMSQIYYIPFTTVEANEVKRLPRGASTEIFGMNFYLTGYIVATRTKLRSSRLGVQRGG